MSLFTRALVRPVAVVATGLVTATMLQAPAHAAPSDQSGTWLKKQLTKQHLVHNDEFDFDDYGLSADVAIALDALDQRRRAVRRIGGSVARNVDAWTAPSAGEVYAGSAAKAAVLAEVSGRDPRSFGGVDLVQRLEGQTADAGPTAGRISDTSAWGDYANVIGQAFAALALAQAGSGEARAARDFLLEQQCADGWFRLSFSDPAAVDQSCDADGSSSADTDVTALSVILLRALPERGKKVNRATRRAIGWLTDTQKRNGSFGGGTATEKSNANSTGLAAWALGDAGRCAPARQAARWVRKLQVRGDLRGTSLAGERGAIAYDRAGYRAGRTHGITDPSRDQWRRATAQAAPGLRFVRGC